MSLKKTALVSTAMLLLISGCSTINETIDNIRGDSAAAPQESLKSDMVAKAGDMADKKHGVDYAALVAMASRPEIDRKDDAARKPAAVMAFFGAKPGMTVMELEAGGGYYTELLSHAVGLNGKVIMQNPQSFDAFLGDALEQRLGNNRLPNVTVSRSLFDDLEAEDASVDLVTWVLGPHELFFTLQDGTGFGDPDTAYAEIARILKPGGSFVALDHAAAAGAPASTGGDTHRIDPNLVIAATQKAGLEMVAMSDVLANPADDYSKNVFDPSVRRKTDRFLVKFRKP